MAARGLAVEGEAEGPQAFGHFSVIEAGQATHSATHHQWVVEDITGVLQQDGALAFRPCIQEAT